MVTDIFVGHDSMRQAGQSKVCGILIPIDDRTYITSGSGLLVRLAQGDRKKDLTLLTKWSDFSGSGYTAW